MKKLIAALFLSLHLFSLCGYVVVHAIAVYNSDRFFEKQVGKGFYNVDELTEVKIPANMPGISEWADYQNVYGEVRFADAAYNYVKMRITHDAIYLKCVPNYATTRLCGQNIINATKLPAIPVNKKDHVPFNKTPNLTVFNQPALQYRFIIPVPPLQHIQLIGNSQPVESAITTPGEPPETV